MNQSVSIGERLREERQRLGMSQPAFGEIGGVTKKTQLLYESGERQPDALYLAAIEKVGVDLLYVLTGRRGGAVAAPVLSLEQQALLAKYEAADEIGRKMAQRALTPEVPQTAVKKVGGRGPKAA